MSNLVIRNDIIIDNMSLDAKTGLMRILNSGRSDYFFLILLSVVFNGQDGLKVTSIDLWYLICHSCLG